MKRCPYCGKENDDAAIHCKECGTEMVGGDYALIALPSLKITCPNCGESEKFEPLVSAYRKFSWSLFFFGGLLSILFLNASRPRRLRCVKCETSFAARSRGAKIMLVLLIVWLAIFWVPSLTYLLYLFFRQ
jgi:hypothetical protein